MRKIMKLSLEKEQLASKKNYKRFDGYEIHLYGNGKDDFSLADQVDKPIVTVHWPIDESDIYDVCSSYDTPYGQQVFALCQKCQAGLVVHAETSFERLLTHPKLESFIEYVRNSGVTLHIENCYREIGAIEALQFTAYFKRMISPQQVYPLLDTCHLMMSEMSFKFEEMSFFLTMEVYSSENFKIHLNDCIGSGEKETGGIHGTNFYANQYLLRNILWKLYVMKKEKDIDADLILEVAELDYVHPINADILARNVDEFWESIQGE